MDRTPLNVVLLGLGVVGGGVAQLLHKDPRFTILGAFCRDLHRERPGVPEIKLTDDYKALINDERTDIVVEVMGGTDVAWGAIQLAIKNGKHVVTANKVLVAEKMTEIMQLLEAHPHVYFRYEAAVGGGVPMIEALRTKYRGRPVHALYGILNGTCNYIGCEMEAGKDFGEALREAQTLGYAEADPSADVDGFDAVAKLRILCKLAFDLVLKPDDVLRIGIRDVHTDDECLAQSLGRTVRLYAVAERDLRTNRIRCRVEPSWLGAPFRNLKGCDNGLVIKFADSEGDVYLEGPGAGREATAGAVFSDLTNIQANHHRVPSPAFPAPAMPAVGVVRGERHDLENFLCMDKKFETDLLCNGSVEKVARSGDTAAVLIHCPDVMTALKGRLGEDKCRIYGGLGDHYPDVRFRK